MTKPPKKISKKEQELLQQSAEITADLQRIQAEFINFKNRSEEEKERIGVVAKMMTVKDLLPVLDDLQRALAHLPKELENNKWAQGVSKAYDRLEKQLQKLGITKIEALNQPFDPHFHEAVQVEGEGEQQVISEVLQDGYLLGDAIIRHAIVKVKGIE